MIRYQPKSETDFATLTDGACAILLTEDAAKQTELSWDLAADWLSRKLSRIGKKRPPKRPSRPGLPVLMPAMNMPRRRPNSIKGCLACIHAIAHIALNVLTLRGI